MQIRQAVVAIIQQLGQAGHSCSNQQVDLNNLDRADREIVEIIRAHDDLLRVRPLTMTMFTLFLVGMLLGGVLTLIFIAAQACQAESKTVNDIIQQA